jgi:hypothetical protein
MFSMRNKLNEERSIDKAHLHVLHFYFNEVHAISFIVHLPSNVKFVRIANKSNQSMNSSRRSRNTDERFRDFTNDIVQLRSVLYKIISSFFILEKCGLW